MFPRLSRVGTFVAPWLFAMVLLPNAAAQEASTDDGRPPAPRVMRNVLVWVPGSLMNWEPLETLDINVLHTLPKPDVRDGISNSGIKPLAMFQEYIDKEWREEVRQLHARGVRVWASIASTGFVPDRFRQYGLDPEIYLARDVDGQPSGMLGGSYGAEVMTSCYNNPHWLKLLQDCVLAFVDAGFDGIWFDVGGYVDEALYYCHCEQCREDWQAFLKEKGLPADTPQPTKDGGKDFSRAINRDHFRWRYGLWEDNFRAIRDAAKAKNPEFLFLHNGSALSWTLYLTAERGLYDLAHLEEWGHSTAPYSVLPSYLLGRAIKPDQPPVLIQNDKPRRNEIQHRIFMAEAYAAGGVPQNRTWPEENQRFYDYIKAHEDYYVGQESLADVAILTSFWSRYFYEIGDKPGSRATRPQYWMGWLLQDLHVPYDYLIVNDHLTAEALRKYRLLILPDLAVIDDKHLDLLRAYVENGGRLLATANTARFDLEMRDRGEEGLKKLASQTAADGERLTVGDGRFVYLAGTPAQDYAEANPRDLNVQESLSLPTPPPASFTEPLEWLLEGPRPVTVEARSTTALVPQRQDGRILLHLINYNTYPDGQKLTPDENVRIRVTLPEGAQVRGVKAVSPDWEGYERDIEHASSDGTVSLTLDRLDAYAVIALEVED